ncbi:cystathionine gamma-synthase [Meinhardsimonia xiamenensis]|jgi:cystathionine gamma-synthase|uniref:Cystathionine gamma-synthase n=1 Tax=Meinhardsimonia xiamenensis TaxID=990712 RepID=A0A1G9H5H2_9RHOB|nr:aminotransferase class I/II-fold pyridoxal phosphate-dependent enzyme [Meinhardsimonia xiamenensis]PRX29781.1 cystathionine gamma-synthase [Meinhardsimonia xiamenensis]SDL07693.1 cystathionine gamma-synthase [Meinhardsimonia xiamenensis]
MAERPLTPRSLPWPESAARPIGAPIQPSVVYAAESPDALDAQYEGRAHGYTYAREGHPNADRLAALISAMERVEGGLVTGSGMAAVAAVLMGLTRAGDHVLGGDQLYGRSLRMMSEELPRLGISTSLADPTDAEAFAAAITPQTRLILIEAVSNPTLRVADLEAIARMARERGILLAVDNTFTTPRALRPFDLGADIVIHSVTKLMAGHSDATLGWVGARDAALLERMRAFAVTLGLTPSPFDCWLAERGLMTFELRHERAEANAARLAEALAGHPGVRRVLYPGRADHPDHARARALLGGRWGNMVSFEIAGGRAAANALVRAAPEIAFAPTLGDVATTLSHPASSSHRALGPEARAALGISEGFFRVSVGVEDPQALISAFGRAIDAAAEAGERA